MNFRHERARRHEPSLDLTPLIDVVFLLLIFFLVTAAFAQQDRAVVPVDLPEGTSGEAATTPERATLFVRADGSFLLELAGHEPQGFEDAGDLRAALEDLHSREPTTPVFLRGDREVRYGRVMEILDLARTVGFSTVFNVIYRAE